MRILETLKELVMSKSSKETATKWIAISGLNGSGCTTLYNEVAKRFKINNRETVKFCAIEKKPVFNDPMLDNLTDMLPEQDRYSKQVVLALENIRANQKIRKLKKLPIDVIISDHCFLDSYIYGQENNIAFIDIDNINEFEKFEQPDAIVYLNCKPEVALNRIKQQLKQGEQLDKSISLEKLTKRHDAILDVYNNIMGKNPILMKALKKPLNIYIDTTNLSQQEMLTRTMHELEKAEMF